MKDSIDYYFRDKETGLCFAVVNSWGLGYNISSVTCVPSTPKVLRIIKKNEKLEKEEIDS